MGAEILWNPSASFYNHLNILESSNGLLQSLPKAKGARRKHRRRFPSSSLLPQRVSHIRLHRHSRKHAEDDQQLQLNIQLHQRGPHQNHPLRQSAQIKLLQSTKKTYLIQPPRSNSKRRALLLLRVLAHAKRSQDEIFPHSHPPLLRREALQTAQLLPPKIAVGVNERVSKLSGGKIPPSLLIPQSHQRFKAIRLTVSEREQNSSGKKKDDND